MPEASRWLRLRGRLEHARVEIRIEEAFTCDRGEHWEVRAGVRNSWVHVRGRVFHGEEAEFRFEAVRDGGPLSAIWDGLSGGNWEEDTLWLVALTSGVPLLHLKEEVSAVLGHCAFAGAPALSPGEACFPLPADGFTFGPGHYPIPPVRRRAPPATVKRWRSLVEAERGKERLALHALEGRPKEVIFALAHTDENGRPVRVSPWLRTLERVAEELAEARWDSFRLTFVDDVFERIFRDNAARLRPGVAAG